MVMLLGTMQCSAASVVQGDGKIPGTVLVVVVDCFVFFFRASRHFLVDFKVISKIEVYTPQT